MTIRTLFMLLHVLISGHAYALILNNPYQENQSQERIYYSSFSEQPKTLDPARSYSSNEYLFISQIYESLLTYDYLKRPYQLVPNTTTEMPKISYLDAQKKPISDSGQVAYTVYTIHIKPGIFYQPHPALAKNKQGEYLYHHLSSEYLDDHNIRELSDFPGVGVRQMNVDDYLYQIKRLANPAVSSPIYGLMSQYIEGFRAFGKSLPKHVAGSTQFLDLRKYSMSGLKKIDDYTFEITLKGRYEQFLFWLAMPFFSPIPWEADAFYSQPGMEQKNLSFSWYPIGTGAFMLTKNNPNRFIVLKKNPSFHEEYFPSEGSEEDKVLGYLNFAGQRLPLIDKIIFTLEKESIPRWNKFLQGYYDASGITADSFDQAIRINSSGEPTLSEEMLEKNIYLINSSEPYIYYMGFNMLDNTIGGTSERARKLRQAISIAVDIDEEIAIFYNGRGTPAQGPIPPGIFGFSEGKAGMNPYVYQWQHDKLKRRSIADAKQLMKDAGYINGIDPATGKNLMLHYDVTTSGNPEDKALFDWMRKQFAAIGIDLNVRATLYNRFQEKMRSGDVQIFSWGWQADYPDPENFLFQLYSRNGKVKFGGENAANYSNPQFDQLFQEMKNRPNDALRKQLIDQMVAIVRHDAPWVWGINPQNFQLVHTWLSHTKPNAIDPGTLKYVSVNIAERNKLRTAWNQPIFWPLIIVLLIILALVLPLIVAYKKKQKQAAMRVKFK